MNKRTRNTPFRSFIPLCGALLLAAGTLHAAPASPSDIAASPASDTSITIHWTDNAANETGYSIHRRVGADGEWALLTDSIPANTEQYTDSDLEPESEYSYRVAAFDGSGSTLAPIPARAVTDEADLGLRTIIFQNGINSYSDAKDVGIASSGPTKSNHGSYVWIDNNSDADNNQALLDFENIFGDAPWQVPAGATVTRATLRIWLGTHSNAESPEAMLFHRMLVPWEDDASWNSSYWTVPTTGVDYNDVDAAAEPDDYTTFDTVGRYYDLDVTPTILERIAGNPSYGWLIRTNSTNGYAYYTTHTAVAEQRPALLVEYDSDPDNAAPTAEIHAPLPGSDDTEGSTNLELTVTDADGEGLDVTVYAREWPLVQDDFSVVVLPDSQYYSARSRGGLAEMFDSQTEWIVANREALNIAFVLHVGDIVNNGDAFSSGAPNSTEWAYARRAMYKLEDPETTGLEEGIPYTITVGNHDQQPRNDPDGGSFYYNSYFGIEHFQDKSYYGGHFGDDNDNHYELFSVGGIKFISISLEYAGPSTSANKADLLQWADDLLKAYPDRRGLITTHHIISAGNPGPWSADGAAIHAALKDNPNLHLMFGGHVRGEGWRTDTFEGNTVHSFLQDYQFYENGGNGFLRIFTFSPRNDEIRIRTYSPWLDVYEDDWNSEFTVPYDMDAPEVPEFETVGTYQVSSGTRVQHPLSDLDAGTMYEWYAVISDGNKTITTDPVTFSTLHPYNTWSEGHFSSGDPQADRLADPDGDGFPNVLEFVFDSNPVDGEPHANMPTMVIGDGHSSVRYTRVQDSKLQWSYAVSSDLVRWVEPSASQMTITERVEDNGDGTETVHLDIDSQVETLFWRIEVH